MFKNSKSITYKDVPCRMITYGYYQPNGMFRNASEPFPFSVKHFPDNKRVYIEVIEKFLKKQGLKFKSIQIKKVGKIKYEKFKK